MLGALRSVPTARTRSLVLAGTALLLSSGASAEWPEGPFSTSGRWMTDATGANVSYAGINWPGSLATMLPEGLQYQSIETIVSNIKDGGMNSIRLTYAIEMIDQIYDNNQQDIPIRQAFIDALGDDDGQDIYQKVITNNPDFDEDTTRLQVYDAVAAECARQHVFVHLDNHISKAGWCCNPLDGNSWWGDTYFDTDRWLRGLSYMAKHGASWKSLTSMSLRNELRQPLTDIDLYESSYNWQDWYKNVKKGADAINQANPDVLIFLSGLDSDTTFHPVVWDAALKPSTTATFDRDAFGDYADKLVLELHIYDNIFGAGTSNCTALAEELLEAGFASLIDGSPNQMPVVMSEFGFVQDGAAKDPYVNCLLQFLGERKASWMIWSVAGSFYIKTEDRDGDDGWGVLSHDWSGFREPQFVDGHLRPLAEKVLSSEPPEVLDQLPAGILQGVSKGGDGDGDSGEGTDGSNSEDEDSGVARPGLNDMQWLVPLSIVALMNWI